MGKYLQTARITFQEYLVYRLNFILWRFRSFVFFVSLLFFWLAVYGNRDRLLGYGKDQMLLYVVGIAFLKSVVLGSRVSDLAGQIRSGRLTKLALKPIGMLTFWFTKDAVDKTLNIGFTIAEVSLALFLFRFSFYFPQHYAAYFAFGLLVFLAIFLHFYLSFFLSLTAFWTEDIWAVRWLFGVVFLEFFAGAFFPIDILPATLQKIIYLTPFPYLIYFPVKIWLEQLPPEAIARAIAVSFVWAVFFFALSGWAWKKGVKNYGAYGG